MLTASFLFNLTHIHITIQNIWIKSLPVLYLQYRGLLYKIFYKTRLEVRGLKHNITKAFPPHHCVRSSNNCSFCSYDVLPTINSLSNTILTKKCIKWLLNAVTTRSSHHSFLKCYPRKTEGHKPISLFHISTHIDIVPSFQNYYLLQYLSKNSRIFAF
jgi:hypothetical protein